MILVIVYENVKTRHSFYYLMCWYSENNIADLNYKHSFMIIYH